MSSDKDIEATIEENRELEVKYNAYYEAIKREKRYVDKRPYSHNIISINLRLIDELGYKKITGAKVIKKLKLDKLGW
jgi:hypothetical protein